MKAITTKFLGATNHRGSRIKATCEAATLTVSYDHGLNSEQNHAAAAAALITKLGWWSTGRHGIGGDWFQGGTGDGSVFVCAVDYAQVLPFATPEPTPAVSPVPAPSTRRALTAEEAEAVATYARTHGRDWKACLRTAWMHASEPGYLHSLRNSHGPSWLNSYVVEGVK